MYDVIIIGAGPAGLMAARELKNENISFLILDSTRKIGLPLRCAEITREDSFLELFGSTNYPFVKNRTSKFAFQTRDTKKVIKKNFLMLDKPQFLQWLAAPVKDKVELKTEVQDITLEDKYLQLHTNRGIFQSKLVILGYGTNYRIQKQFGLVQKEIELVPCIGGLFKSDSVQQDTAIFYYDEETHTASWVFPKQKGIVNAGSGIMLKAKHRQNLERLFKKAMKHFNITLTGQPSFGGVFVTNGPIKKTYSDRMLVCGDAAGHVFGAIGEGIYFALKAGKIAGEIAKKATLSNNLSGKFLKRYEKEWKKAFGKIMHSGIVFATVLFFLMRHRLVGRALRIIKPQEIYDIWIKGKVSWRIKLLYLFVKAIGKTA